MRIETEELGDGILKVGLHGRMDIAGVDVIAMQLTAVTAPVGRRVIVDLSGVDFLASIGVRAILQNARAMSLRGGAMAVCCARPVVTEVLESAGVGNVVPVCANLSAARATFKEA
jgi:anti-sigma B factor antagonist